MDCLCYVEKYFFIDVMNVTFSILTEERSFKSEIQILNMIHFKAETLI